MKRYWYKEGVIYSLDIKSFRDGNGDGVGDFQGLLEKFDHLLELGVTCLWMLPFFCSENKDAGYDVIDYYSVDPKVGRLEDFARFIEQCKAHNVKVIIDLVVNHTSNQHEWFKEAQRDRSSKYWNYYIWLDEKPDNDKEDVVFKNVEDSNWQYDEQAGAYYYHTFYAHQPDLNVANPEVQDEILKVIDFWMHSGVSGFRIDAVPHILRDKGKEKFHGDPYDVLDKWHGAVVKHDIDGILIAEADVEPEDYRNFLGKGERIQGLLNFYLNNYIFLSLTDRDPRFLAEAFQKIPAVGGNEQYLNFLRNHDELDLERLTEDERKRVFNVFAPEEQMRLYGRGIRRRLPPMLNNNKELLELTFSLLFSLPGTPVLRYGEEIGMGDDLRLKERNSVRTSMQWDNSKNGGFSSAPAAELFWPVVSSGEYSYEKVNVAAQKRDPSSLLNTVISMISKHNECLAFGYGDFVPLNTGHPQVLGHMCRYNNETVVAFHNFSDETCTVAFSLGRNPQPKLSLLLGTSRCKVAETGMEIQLPGFAYSWWKTT